MIFPLLRTLHLLDFQHLLRCCFSHCFPCLSLLFAFLEEPSVALTVGFNFHELFLVLCLHPSPPSSTFLRFHLSAIESCLLLLGQVIFCYLFEMLVIASFWTEFLCLLTLGYLLCVEGFAELLRPLAPHSSSECQAGVAKGKLCCGTPGQAVFPLSLHARLGFSCGAGLRFTAAGGAAGGAQEELVPGLCQGGESHVWGRTDCFLGKSQG